MLAVGLHPGWVHRGFYRSPDVLVSFGIGWGLPVSVGLHSSEAIRGLSSETRGSGQEWVYPKFGSRRTSALVHASMTCVGRKDRGVGSVG